MHSEMQNRKYHLLDLENLRISVYNIISNIQNHGSTFIFDRGKNTRNFLLLQISWQLHRQNNNFQNQRSLLLEKMMSKTNTASQILFPTKTHNSARPMNSTGEAKRKKDRKHNKIDSVLKVASALAPSFENTIDKYTSMEAIDNLIALASRGEMTLESNCILLTGLSISDPKFSSNALKKWIQKMIPHLEQMLQIRVMTTMLLEFLNAKSDATIMHDGNSCAIPIPIQTQTFRLAGPSIPQKPSAMGINLGDSNNPFFMYIAIPTQTDPLRSICTAVEICTLRGLPVDPFEIQAIIAMVHHKIKLYFAPLTNLQVNDFDVVIHRRLNVRQHHNFPAFELVITIYCRPQGMLVTEIRKCLQLEEEPAEINLDWKAEKWTSFAAMSNRPPSALLLHRTPSLCIQGCADDTPTEYIIRAVYADNPSSDFLADLLHIWRGPDGIHFVLADQPPVFTLGSNLLEIGAKRIAINSHDNPHMIDERRAVAGDLVHEEFALAMPAGKWSYKMVTAWETRRNKVVKHSKTLKQGHKLAVTHAGSSSWAPPSFLGQEIPTEKVHSQESETTRLQESIRSQRIQLKRIQESHTQIHELSSEDSDEDFDSGSLMSEESGNMKGDSKDDTSRMLNRLLESQADMEARIDQRIDARLLATLHTFFSTQGHQNSLGTSSRDGPQAGEHHSPTQMNHE